MIKDEISSDIFYQFKNNEVLEKSEKIISNFTPIKNENINESSRFFTTSYEVIPSSYKLKIYFYDRTIKIYDVNVKYVYDAHKTTKENIKKDWIFHNQKAYSIRKEGITLGGENVVNQTAIMEFTKNFDKDVSIKFDFELLKDKVTDLKFTFGERLYFSFNNKRIDLYRKELDSKTKKKKLVRYDFVKDFSRFKKGDEKNNNKYSIYIKRYEGNKYSLELIDHNNNLNNKKQIYIDDKLNNIEFERYKNLRILVGSKDMNILIKKIEVF
jgi:hypothetical protein